MSYLVLFCFCVFSSFSIAITSLGEERANFSVFRMFVRFALVWFLLFSLLLLSRKGCDLLLWHSPDFCLTFFYSILLIRL